MEKNYLKSQIRILITFFGLFTVILGLVYPGIVMFINQLAFSGLSNGSLIVEDKILGSELLCQPFTKPEYFWGRPSATTPAYNTSQSTGSNLNPANPQLFQNIQSRINAFKQIDPSNALPIPIDLLTTSASGLDPHISILGAYYQVPRIAKARKIDEAKLYDIVNSTIEYRQFGLLGEPRVNVIKLNLILHKVDRA